MAGHGSGQEASTPRAHQRAELTHRLRVQTRAIDNALATGQARQYAALLVGVHLHRCGRAREHDEGNCAPLNDLARTDPEAYNKAMVKAGFDRVQKNLGAEPGSDSYVDFAAMEARVLVHEQKPKEEEGGGGGGAPAEAAAGAEKSEVAEALDQARDALDAIKMEDLAALRRLQKPPEGLERPLIILCHVFGHAVWLPSTEEEKMAAAASGGAGEWWDVCAKKLMGDVGYLLTRMENFGVAEIKSIKPRKKHEGSAAPTLVEQLAHPDADPSVVAAVPSRFVLCDALPETYSGKYMRALLHKLLAAVLERAHVRGLALSSTRCGCSPAHRHALEHVPAILTVPRVPPLASARLRPRRPAPCPRRAPPCS